MISWVVWLFAPLIALFVRPSFKRPRARPYTYSALLLLFGSLFIVYAYFCYIRDLFTKWDKQVILSLRYFTFDLVFILFFLIGVGMIVTTILSLILSLFSDDKNRSNFRNALVTLASLFVTHEVGRISLSRTISDLQNNYGLFRSKFSSSAVRQFILKGGDNHGS